MEGTVTLSLGKPSASRAELLQLHLRSQKQSRAVRFWFRKPSPSRAELLHSGALELSCNNFSGEVLSCRSRVVTAGKPSLEQGCKLLCLLCPMQFPGSRLPETLPPEL